MRSIDKVLAALEARDCRPRGNETAGWKALCCAHEDRNPSLKIDYREDRVLVQCYAGCPAVEIVAALGMEWSDLFDEEPDPKPIARRVTERYDYTDEDGKLLYQVERLAPKAFRQRRPGASGDWIYKLDDTRRVLYRLPALCDAVMLGERVVVVEGEKDVHALEAKGIVATTNPHGAGKWRREYSEVLRGAQVAIIADHDEPDPKTARRPGYDHALTVYRALRAAECEVKIFEPAEGFKDVSEQLKAGVPLGQLQSLSEQQLESYTTVDEEMGLLSVAVANGNGKVRKPLKVMTADELMALPGADPERYLLGPLVYRGHRLIIGAETGAGKTSLINHMAAAIIFQRPFLEWTGSNAKRVLLLDVEQGTDDVQAAWRRSGLADAHDLACCIHEPDGLQLDTDPKQVTELEDILADGWDLVIADPAYQLWTGDQTDERAVRKIMALFDAWRRRFNFALIMPMHTRKPVQGASFTINEIFGSKAFTWGAEAIIGLRRLGDGAADLHWWKDRQGKLPAIHSRWGLIYDEENGFRKNPQQGPKPTTKERVLELLRAKGSLTQDELWFKLGGPEGGPKQRTIRNALDDLGEVTHDGGKLKDRRYSLMPTLLDSSAEPPPASFMDVDDE